MSSLARSRASIALTVLTGTILASSRHVEAAPPASPPGKAVTVVNDAGNPVPVLPLGTTPVSGNVSITGTPDVNVVNTPLVEVGNTADNPVPVALQGIQEGRVTPATRSFAFRSDVPSGESRAFELPEPIILSTITVFSPDDFVTVLLSGEPGSGACVGDRCGFEDRVRFSFFVSRDAQTLGLGPIPVRRIHVHCGNAAGIPCNYNYIFGYGWPE